MLGKSQNSVVGNWLYSNLVKCHFQKSGNSYYMYRRWLLLRGDCSTGLDKVLFSVKKYWHFSCFSSKTYVVVLIRSASNEYRQHLFSWRNNKNIVGIPRLIWSCAVHRFHCIIYNENVLHLRRLVYWASLCFARFTLNVVLKLENPFYFVLLCLKAFGWVSNSASELQIRHFFNRKVLVFFLFLHKIICCGTRNASAQSAFSRRNKKNTMWIPHLELWCRLECRPLSDAIFYSFRSASALFAHVYLIQYVGLIRYSTSQHDQTPKS